jgi:simple sugar transport system ATP-binding protein
MVNKTPLLMMRGMSKSFGSVKAVVDVDLVLNRGEILGLVGDNAAGKSTLMKMLTAVHEPDEGEIFIEGEPVKIDSPRKARELGIEMIYQDFSLAPNLNITENILLGREIKKTFMGIPVLNRKMMNQLAEEALRGSLIRIDSVQSIVTDLSGGQQQGVAIARAIAFGAKIIIMDEPTASLSIKAITPLLDRMKQLRDQGISMIFITHRIQDIFSTCDRVMVLRRGSSVCNTAIENTSVDEIFGLITGRHEGCGQPNNNVE